MQKLFLSHIDAWCVTFVAALMPLWIHDAIRPSTIYVVIAITVGNWLAFAVNDFFDQDSDAINPTKANRNFFLETSLSNRQLGLIYTIVAGAILASFLQFGGRGAFVVALGVAVMWAYSAPPLRLKNRPIIDLITHTLFVETFPYWALLFIIDVSWLPIDRAILLLAALASFTAQLEQQARDYETDRLTDVTFTTAYGLQVNLIVLRIATVLLITIGVLSFALGFIDMRFFPIALLGTPIALRRFTRQTWSPKQQQLAYLLAVCALVYMLVLVLFL